MYSYKVIQWCDTWKLPLNIKKCVVLHYGHRNPGVQYSINGSLLPISECTRDLGVLMSNSGKFREHCEQVAAKARRLTGLMLRALHSRQRTVILPVYKSLIRPLLEYATVIWSPFYKSDIKEIESVQRYITKRIHGLKHLSYTARLCALELSTLENRRSYYDLVECYKLVHGNVHCACSEQLQQNCSNTRGHQYKLTAHTSTLEVRFHFFTERVVNVWNALPADIATITTLPRFKFELRKHLQAY